MNLRKTLLAASSLVVPAVLSDISLAQCWDPLADMPTARHQLAAAGLDGLLYAVGGKTGNTCTGLQAIEAYDAATNTWNTTPPLAPLPTPRFYPAAAALDGLLFVIGGDIGCGSRSSANEAYDPAANAWIIEASMPTARTGLAVAVVNGFVYAVGAVSGNSITDVVEAYDPSANSWTPRNHMPMALAAMTASGVGGKVWVIGGQSTTAVVDEVVSYDPTTDTWTTGYAPMPTLRLGFSSAVLNGRIYVVGGYDNATGQALDTLEIYDPSTDSWEVGCSMITPRAWLATGTVNGSIYAVGGGFDSQVLGANERISPSLGSKYCTANANSTGASADISASGSASWTAGDLTLLAMPVPNQPGIFFHALNQSQIPFGNGFLCATGGISRGGVSFASGNLASYTYDNSDTQHSLASHIGTTRNFQYWFRDPMGGGAFFNTSNAISIGILP